MVSTPLLKNISIIIPLAPNETHPEKLLKTLKKTKAQIILSSEGSRAKSLNAGAHQAKNQFLWFLHADTRITLENLNMLEHAIEMHPQDLHYFDLAFDQKGLMALNAWGANKRSHIFGTPFGDQGFCISKPQFEKIGGYPEDTPYGEDLMFVWSIRQKGIHLNNIPSQLVTSARKYTQQGWLKLTCLYQWRWISMSLPEAWILVRKKS